MGDGARRAQMENRFGLGQPVDTYGEPCPHVRAATQVKEAVETLFKRKVIKGQNLRVELPNSYVEKMNEQKGVVQVGLINPITGHVHSFYKAFRSVKNPEVNIPTKIMDNFEPGQEVILKTKPLPLSKFIEQLRDEASKMVRLNKDGRVMINLGGNAFQKKIEDLKYDYTNNATGLGGSAFIAFQVNDFSGKAWKFTLYDNGMDKSRLVVEYGNRPRPIVGMSYNAKRDAVSVEYYDKGGNRTITLLFREPPDEIDLDTRRIPEEMRLRWETAVNSNPQDKVEMGKIGAEVGAKIAEKEYNVKVHLSRKIHGPDAEIVINNEPSVFEAKSTADESELSYNLRDAEKQVHSRNKPGIIVSLYIDTDTGFFEYEHKYVPGPSIRLNRYEGEES